MLIAGRRIFPKLLQLVDKTGSRELFTLAVVVMAVGVAYGSAKLFGVSFALGAFFAGVVLNGSELSKRVAKKLSPLEDIFAVLFFVAMGMLFDPGIVVREPMGVLAALAIVVVGKSVAAALIVLLMRRPLDTALTVSAGLAQIGEFSFILAGMAVTLKLLSQEGFNLVIAAAMISILINPLMFRAMRALGRRISPS
jgi:CPA2 family monovalent cation:H+ antiporter-2